MCVVTGSPFPYPKPYIASNEVGCDGRVDEGGTHHGLAMGEYCASGCLSSTVAI
jgi:hypothetical protein